MRKAFLPLLFAGALISCGDQKVADQPLVKDAATNTPSEAKPQASEFADAQYMQIGSQALKQFEERKLEEWATIFADNVVYQWSSGDSLVGKKAIVDFWKKTYESIESLTFSNDIWLPIKVNQPQKGPDMPGVWLVGWNQVNIKYKNGKELQFWVHIDQHFDANNKVDRSIMYVDNAPIRDAMSAK